MAKSLRSSCRQSGGEEANEIRHANKENNDEGTVGSTEI